MDKNHDGVVTIDEFLDCCRCDQAITNSMLVFDSTIWPRGGDESDGNRKKLTSSTQKEPEKNEHHRQQQQKVHDPISSHPVKLNVHSMSKHNGNESTKSKLYDNQSHKKLSPSFGENLNRNGPTTKQHSQQQQQQYHHHPLTVFGNKTKNNVGHKASQTKRIQLSTAAKRCKSINRSNAVDNNNSKAINLDDICKAEDVEEVDDETDNCAAVTNTPNKRHNIDVDTVANNSISTQSAESPTLVKVKTWYTDSTVSLPTSSHGVIFWYWTFFLVLRSPPKTLIFPFLIQSTDNDDKEVNFRQFYDLWHLLTLLFIASLPIHLRRNFFFVLLNSQLALVSITTKRW